MQIQQNKNKLTIIEQVFLATETIILMLNKSFYFKLKFNSNILLNHLNFHLLMYLIDYYKKIHMFDYQ
jgi:hypothetical protein